MSYIIMPRCNCSRCLRESSSKSSSYRDDKHRHKRSSSKNKRRSCSCNKCNCRLSPKCYNDEDSGDDECENKSKCSSYSHQFIITVKNKN